MVQLFLSEPRFSDDGDGDATRERVSLLRRLESIMCSVITSGCRSEARLWLCNTVSCINSITPKDQHDLFVDLLRSKPAKRGIASQLLQMILEKKPKDAVPIIVKKSYMLEKFFEGNPRRILQWFGNFSSTGDSDHKTGARALSQFAFVNRDTCWEELEWKGKHGQSPAMVATKPHYFLDLDVLRTVENFLDNVPDFWSSDELAESLKDGEIFGIDTKFFVDNFVQLMYEDNLEVIWPVISDFLMQENFSFLCQHLLILLDERQLHVFLNSLSRILYAKPTCKYFGFPSYWLENLLQTCNDCPSMDELLLLNAVINQGRQLICLVHDEEHGEGRGKIEELLSEINMASSKCNHWALMKECAEMKKPAAVTLLGLQSWALHYSMSKECKTPESWESLFTSNKINFRKSNNYSLVRLDRVSRRNGSDLNDGGPIRPGTKRQAKSRKRRRKRYHCQYDSSEDELLELESHGWLSTQTGGGSWLLSTDDYSSSWNSADLPEHLARHCFSTWMKWLFSNYS